MILKDHWGGHHVIVARVTKSEKLRPRVDIYGTLLNCIISKTNRVSGIGVLQNQKYHK